CRCGPPPPRCGSFQGCPLASWNLHQRSRIKLVNIPHGGPAAAGDFALTPIAAVLYPRRERPWGSLTSAASGPTIAASKRVTMLPLTPTKLGRYEIVDEIGKGAMGVFCLARDPLIGRLVALKTFRIGYSIRDAELEQFRARFIREAQSAGILSHPNIVTIHDVVERAEEGWAFIAMEYVHGTNPKAVLRDASRRALTDVAEILGQVAAGLDYAHSCKVIHRDIKPANILITTDNRVKITDFGIARLGTSNLTQEGQLLGTPNYMSPEQILGRDVDARADIFSLGVVLYEMVT